MVAVAEIIEVPNPLKGKVSYGPDGVDANMLEKAEQLIANLQGDFVVWVQDDMKKLTQHFDEALAQPAGEGRTQSMKEVFGVAHDMKGQGGSFGFPLITNVANTMCRFMEAHPNFGDQEMGAIKLHVDTLRLIVAERLSGDGGTKGQQLIKGLELVLQKFAAK